MGTFSTSTIHAALLSRHAQIPHRHVGDSRPGCVRGPANAATPSIRSTKQYQELKAYVSQLNAKKNQQQTPAEISKYRSELSKKRAKASMKVRANYQAQLAKPRTAGRTEKRRLST